MDSTAKCVRKHATVNIVRALVAIKSLASAISVSLENGAKTVNIIVLKTVQDVIGTLKNVKNVIRGFGVRFAKRLVQVNVWRVVTYITAIALNVKMAFGEGNVTLDVVEGKTARHVTL